MSPHPLVFVMWGAFFVWLARFVYVMSRVMRMTRALESEHERLSRLRRLAWRRMDPGGREEAERLGHAMEDNLHEHRLLLAQTRGPGWFAWPTVPKPSRSSEAQS